MFTMLAQRLKNALGYLAILGIGLGAGYALPIAVQWLKPAYTEGEFAKYYPDANTQVVVYGTPTCPYCAKTRDYLRTQHIAFSDADVTTSAKARAQFDELGGAKVPVILVGKRRINGFNQGAIDAALAKIRH